MFRTDNPEQDAQDFYENQKEFDQLECQKIDRPQYDCDCPECSSIDWCSCGEVKTECSYHKIPKMFRWTYNFRSNFIYRFQDLI